MVGQGGLLVLRNMSEHHLESLVAEILDTRSHWIYSHQFHHFYTNHHKISKLKAEKHNLWFPLIKNKRLIQAEGFQKEEVMMGGEGIKISKLFHLVVVYND